MKGYYNGRIKQLKQILEQIMDMMAMDCNTYQQPLQDIELIPSPLSKVQILHNNAIITSRLAKVIKPTCHTDAIKANILKQTG